VVSRPSSLCFNTVSNEKAEFLNQGSTNNMQAPLSEDALDEPEIIVTENKDTNPTNFSDIEYTVQMRPSCESGTLKLKKEKAVIVILVRNNELQAMRRTMREFEE
jgi:alpha 1,2-mannosyltransferase